MPLHIISSLFRREAIYEIVEFFAAIELMITAASLCPIFIIVPALYDMSKASGL